MNRMKVSVFWGALFVCAFLVVTPLHLSAADQVPAEGTASQGPGMEPLLRMANFLAQMKQFSVVLDSGYDVVQESGQKIEFGERRALTVVRPDRLRVDVKRSDGQEFSTVFDGKALTAYSPKKNYYAVSEHPGDIDGAILHFVRDLRMRLPLAMMWVTTLPRELERRVVSTDIVETSPLWDVPCTHVAAELEDVDFQIWIPSEGDPLPRKVIITYKHEEGEPQYWAKFSEWNLSANPPDSLFALDIPKDAGRIQFLAQVPKPAEPEAKPAAKKGGKK